MYVYNSNKTCISCRILYTSCDSKTPKICSHQRVSKVLCVPRNLPGQRPREQRSGVKVLAKECWHKERPKPKAARVVKVSQKLVRQGRWGEEMELEMPLFLSKLVSSNSFKIPGREKLVAKEPLEVVQWRLSRLHPVGFGFLWQRDSRTSVCRWSRSVLITLVYILKQHWVI